MREPLFDGSRIVKKLKGCFKMNKALRKPVIAGNWKMNKTPDEAKTLIEELKPLVKDADCEVVCCVPYIDLYAAMEAAEGSNIKIGAENCHWAEKGAFTGEVSAKMLKAAGVPYDYIGGRSTLCNHRPQRAPSVFRRDGCHCPQPCESRSQRGTQGYSLRR